ncbi:hypothetical protein [Argonema antarcticum]|nr:hypothetical protein [Argonema antarcticum]MCL1470232.1 hypothetical protein [Argonema antarcticum A004/B2]
MPTVNFSFHAELNFFLPSNRRNIRFSHVFAESPSIKDTIELCLMFT